MRTTMNKEVAASIALKYVNQLYSPHVRDGDLVILTDRAIETDYGWFFTYNTRAFVEENDVFKSMRGNGPILVLKKSGEVRSFSSAYSLEQAVHVFEQE
jgi:hypothetical protein